MSQAHRNDTPNSSIFTSSRARGRLRMALLGLVGIALVTSYAAAALASFPMPFPARGDYLDELPFEAYYSSGGHTGYVEETEETEEAGYSIDDFFPQDFGIVRFDGSQWRPTIPGGNTANDEDFLIYGAPLYSPVDGVVISCWRTWPDDSSCDEEVSQCLSGGNHLNIRTEQGDHVVYLGHLQPDSIPEYLCPTTDPGPLPPAGSTSCQAGADWIGFPDAIRTDYMPGGPPVIRKGDFIGRGGNSGTGTNQPHLHVHVKQFTYDNATPPNPCQDGDGMEEIEYTESWYTERDEANGATASDWLPAQQTALPLEPSGWPRVLVWPDPVGPRLDDQVFGTGHATPHLSNVPDEEGGVLAFRNEDQHLEIHSYGLVDGNIQFRDEVEEGSVLALDLAQPYASERDIVAAVRTAGGNLKLIPYALNGWGTISRQYGQERTENAIFGVRSTRSPRSNGVTLAIRDGNNRLKVIEYAVDPATMEITRLGSSALADYASRIAIDRVRRGRGLGEPYYPVSGLYKGVVTAERRLSDGHLVVRSWAVSAARNVSLTDTFDTGIDVADVDITTIRGPLRDTVLVTAENSSGNFRAFYFYVTRAGDLVLDDIAMAGEIGALASTGVGGEDAVTAVSDSNGDLKLISLGFGNEIFRSGTRAAGSVSKVHVDAAHPAWEDPVLLNLIQASGGGVKLIVFGSNFDGQM